MIHGRGQGDSQKDGGNTPSILPVYSQYFPSKNRCYLDLEVPVLLSSTAKAWKHTMYPHLDERMKNEYLWNGIFISFKDQEKSAIYDNMDKL